MHAVLVARALELLAGFLVALALPAVDDPAVWRSALMPVLALAGFGVLGYRLRSVDTVRAGFITGFFFALGFHAYGLSWITHAFYVDADAFGALAIPAVAGLAAGMALYGALAVALAAWPGGLRGGRVMGAARFAAAWTVAEMIRGVFLTGFPWNPIASVWIEIPTVVSATYFIGVHGLGAVTVMAGVALGLVGLRLKPLAVGITPLVLCAGTGFSHLAPTSDFHPDVTLRLVQASIAQEQKWATESRRANFYEHVRLSQTDVPVTAVIWPETASTFDLSRRADWASAAQAAVPDGGVLITGMPRSTPRPEGGFDLFNALGVMDGSGDMIALFDKFHLVPFGEYVPLADLLPITSMTGEGFTAGPGPQTLAVPGLPPFSPLICYEIIFPGTAFEPDNRPDWLLNVTNDGWFGDSIGPRQHLAAARLRAVEEGLPVVRVANTGISALIDPWGRVLVSVGVNRTATLDVPLPEALAPRLLSTNATHLIVFIFAVMMLIGPPVVDAARRRR